MTPLGRLGRKTSTQTNHTPFIWKNKKNTRTFCIVNQGSSKDYPDHVIKWRKKDKIRIFFIEKKKMPYLELYCYELRQVKYLVAEV